MSTETVEAKSHQLDHFECKIFYFIRNLRDAEYIIDWKESIFFCFQIAGIFKHSNQFDNPSEYSLFKLFFFSGFFFFLLVFGNVKN